MVDRRRLVLVLLLAVFLGGVFTLLRTTGPPAGNCTADGLEIAAPAGWNLARDRSNVCEWTLFNEAGDRAPGEIYEGLPVDPPPSVLLNPVRVWAGVAIAGSLVGMIWIVRGSSGG